MARPNPRLAQVSQPGRAGVGSCSMTSMRAEDIFPAWCDLDRLKSSDEISEFEARLKKYTLFRQMLERELEPDGLVGIIEEPVPAF